MRETLMLLPGLLCDEAVWSKQLPQLSQDRQCVVADYGDADSIEAMAETVLKIAPDYFSVAGHSMGARVALEIMRVAPERVERLALMSTGTNPRAEGEPGELEKQKRYRLLDLARDKGMNAMAQVWLEGMVPPQRVNDKTLWNDMSAMVERKNPDIFEAQINALLARPDANPILEKITCLTLISCGREDVWSPLSQHEHMLSLTKEKGYLDVFEDCGHMSPMEQPVAVLESLQRWLNKE